jgi:5-methylcytosine-specific restriction enzyme B
MEGISMSDIMIIAPFIETRIINNTEIAIISSDEIKFRELEIGDEIVVIDSKNIYHITVYQNKQNVGAKYKIEGKVIAKSHDSDYILGKQKYELYFQGKNVPHIKENLEKTYIDFKIVPTTEKVESNYRLTQGLNGAASKLNFSNISNKWDYVMSSGDFGDEVIGHEELKEEVIGAIASGKHILLYGPPGTGKTMISSRISKVFDCDYKVYTANAEWTADDTIGGYKFSIDSQGKEQRIEPSNGYVTEAILDCNKNVSAKFYDSDSHIYRGTWVVIDELNRAKMDFAFGALFTALDKDYSMLNLPQYDKYDDEKSKIFIPNTFRIIGTINNFDKNFLFKLSYALSRRFAHIYVGVPSKDNFEKEISSILNKIKKELINEYGIREPELNGMELQLGVQKVKEIVSYLRGYDNDKIRDIGTALIIDTLRLYFVQKYVTKVSSDDNKMIDIAISSIIIPSLEGAIEDTRIIKDKIKGLDKSMRFIEEFESLNY